MAHELIFCKLFLQGGSFQPGVIFFLLGIFGIVWGHFWLLGMGRVSAPGIQRSGILLKISQFIGQTSTRIIWSKMSTVPRLRNQLCHVAVWPVPQFSHLYLDNIFTRHIGLFVRIKVLVNVKDFYNITLNYIIHKNKTQSIIYPGTDIYQS